MATLNKGYGMKVVKREYVPEKIREFFDLKYGVKLKRSEVLQLFDKYIASKGLMMKATMMNDDVALMCEKKIARDERLLRVLGVLVDNESNLTMNNLIRHIDRLYDKK